MDAETVHYHQVVFTSKSHSNSLSHGIINDDKLNDSTDCSDASELSMEWHQKFDKTYVAQTLTTAHERLMKVVKGLLMFTVPVL